MRPLTPSARGAAALGALGFATTLAVLPATAQSDAQGTPVTTTTASAATAPAPTATTAKAPARTSIRVRQARRNVTLGRHVIVRGTLRPGLAGKTVRLLVRRGHGWRTVARSRTKRHGAFRLSYAPPRNGTYRMRLRFRGDRHARASTGRLGTVNVFRKVLASWYGGGGAVACGGAKGRARYGVAHKTLPCGTRVKLRYRGRTVVAKVIDRGPYVAGREYDLTGATKRALGAGDLTTIQATR